jgi:hypothetical protein
MPLQKFINFSRTVIMARSTVQSGETQKKRYRNGAVSFVFVSTAEQDAVSEVYRTSSINLLADIDSGILRMIMIPT